MDVIVRAREGGRLGTQQVEVVERKGLGHPDTICDALAEAVSRRLCRHYLDHFGRVLHHNVDKVLLCAGASRPAFGGGEVLEPIEIYLAGRATDRVGDERIPVHELAVEASKAWLREHMHALDVDRDIVIVARIRPGSTELTGLFARDEREPLANDTSCGVGFAPLTELERVTLEIERRLNDSTTRAAEPAIGEDIKVMGVRRGDNIKLTIGCAFIGRYVADARAYARCKDFVRQFALQTARSHASANVDVVVNTADDPVRGEFFLTVCGTSAEAGDDGEVGRGNRTNGLITPYRPMTLEAAAGKNPVNHVGKLYNVLAGDIASTLVQETDVEDASCVLVSQIGRSVSDPQIVDIRLGCEEPTSIDSLHEVTVDIARAQLADIARVQEEIVTGRRGLY
jgi:S-adenosylmethionine synthetase